MIEIPKDKPERKEKLDDNARKFISKAIEQKFLDEHSASSFKLTVDWLETGDDTEKKLAYKEFKNGEIQILLIAKVTKDGIRTSEKEKISEDEYNKLLTFSNVHLEKRRYEFDYTQNDTSFACKYDEFANGFQILEVDSMSEEQRNRFDANNFPYHIEEVTGDIQYYGYRVASIT